MISSTDEKILKRGFGKRLFRVLAYLCLAFSILSLTTVLLLRWFPVPISSFMLYKHFEDLSEKQTLSEIRYQWVNAEKISPMVKKAVIASEDQRFFEHNGFDFVEIEQAIKNYKKGRKLRGASTISQQVAKNLFLFPSKTFFRKGLEVWFTLLIEMCWSKERILEVYLNIAELGDHLFGIDSASRHYFGIPAAKLNAHQAALLAATLPNPLRFQAQKPSSYVLKRQRWILRQMRNLG